MLCNSRKKLKNLNRFFRCLLWDSCLSRLIDEVTVGNQKTATIAKNPPQSYMTQPTLHPKRHRKLHDSPQFPKSPEAILIWIVIFIVFIIINIISHLFATIFHCIISLFCCFMYSCGNGKLFFITPHFHWLGRDQWQRFNGKVLLENFVSVSLADDWFNFHKILS